MVAIYAILALSLNITTGLAGQVSVGHAAFFGLGAYTGAILTTRYGMPFIPALLASFLVAALVGSILGIISLRLRHDFLVIATIGLNFVIEAMFLYVPFFGGAFGVGGIRLPFGLAGTGGRVSYFFIVLAGALLVVAIHELIRRSWMGAAFMAIRDDEWAAMGSSVDVQRYKITAFIIGTGLAGLAGGLYGPYITVLHAEDFHFTLSVTIVTMMALGGMGTLWGPILGAMLLGTFEQLFAFVQDYQLLIFGTLLMLTMRFSPDGLVGLGKRLREGKTNYSPSG